MKRKCIKCGREIGIVGNHNDFSITGAVCLDCFIDYLERKIDFLLKKGFTLQAEELKKTLVRKLIERQEEE